MGLCQALNRLAAYQSINLKSFRLLSGSEHASLAKAATAPPKHLHATHTGHALIWALDHIRCD